MYEINFDLFGNRVDDRCHRNIRPLPKCFLMELKFADKDKAEIFGAKDNSERQVSLRRIFPFRRWFILDLGGNS